MRIDVPPRKTASISLTPLIDVVFILLVFFMLATRFVDLSRQPLSVAVTSEQPDSSEQVLLIHVIDSQTLTLNSETLSLAQADQRLAELSHQPVYVDSEGSASLQAVLNVTDLLQAHGYREVHLELLP